MDWLQWSLRVLENSTNLRGNTAFVQNFFVTGTLILVLSP